MARRGMGALSLFFAASWATTVEATPPTAMPSGDATAPTNTIYMTPGALYSVTSGGGQQAQGLGFEVALVFYPRLSPSDGSDGSMLLGLGPLFQVQSYENSNRFSAGGQINYRYVGVELAYARRVSDQGAPPIQFIQATPFFSIGFFYLGLRIAEPVAPASAQAEVGVTMGLKLPLRVSGDGYFDRR